MSGWNDSDRKARLPANWTDIVRFVKGRAANRCEWRLKSGKRCPRRGADVDHRRPGDDHSLSNLQLLCTTHHGKKTAWEAYQAKTAKKASRFRAPEAHPGAVR